MKHHNAERNKNKKSNKMCEMKTDKKAEMKAKFIYISHFPRNSHSSRVIDPIRVPSKCGCELRSENKRRKLKKKERKEEKKKKKIDLK